jgi:superfamily II DNA or RNA helicase
LGEVTVGKDFDELANGRSGHHSTPGDQFRDTFLSKYPKSQWPSFIDEIAIDLSADIRIGDTQLDQYNFPREIGPFYQRGVVAASGNNSDIERILDETIDETDLGTIVYQLNQLSYEIEQSNTGLQNVHNALEAVIEKLLTSKAGIDLGTQTHRDTGAIADVVMDLFSNTEVAEHAETVVDEFENSLGQGLLARLDEPQMMTPLWEHQLEALSSWSDADYRGYADMATATGKTVLGLGAIALRYGSLHPRDEVDGDTASDPNDRLLIVAHSDLILEQWRREFEKHLNIPKERTEGSDEIKLTWGEIHFRTPQRLINQSQYPYDLVILDEAHHYATGSEWGSLLEHFDVDIIALSGSVDDAGADSEALQERLQSKVGPEIQRYSITDAQEDGIIPAFDWEVRYAPYEHDNDFVELSQSLTANFQSFQEQVTAGDFEVDRRMQTFEDVRTFSHTTEGKELKRSNSTFRELSTAVFSRRTKRWHLSPSLDSIVDVVAEHSNDHVVVLVDSNAQVETLTELIRNEVATETVQAATTEQSRAELRDQLDEFNDAEAGGVVVGTGDLLGEGVDIPRANVAVNMATGGVNTELVQRIGRVLRNPTGSKHAHFYNVVGIPDEQAAIPAQDGRRLIEHAGEFCALGARFNNLPGFATAADVDEAALSELLAAGSDAIRSLQAENLYEDPEDPAEAEHLNGLLATVDRVSSAEASTILGEWSEYSWFESIAGVDTTKPGDRAAEQSTLTIDVRVRTPGGNPVPSATLSVTQSSNEEVTVANIEDGQWKVHAPMDAEVTLEAAHPDFQSATWDRVIDEATDDIELVLEPTYQTAGVTYTVPESMGEESCIIQVRNKNGGAVGDAAISITSDEAVDFVRTGNDGRTTLQHGKFSESVNIAVRHPTAGVRTTEVPLPTEAGIEISLPNE